MKMRLIEAVFLFLVYIRNDCTYNNDECLIDEMEDFGCPTMS